MLCLLKQFVFKGIWRWIRSWQWLRSRRSWNAHESDQRKCWSILVLIDIKLNTYIFVTICTCLNKQEVIMNSIKEVPNKSASESFAGLGLGKWLCMQLSNLALKTPTPVQVFKFLLLAALAIIFEHAFFCWFVWFYIVLLLVIGTLYTTYINWWRCYWMFKNGNWENIGICASDT